MEENKEQQITPTAMPESDGVAAPIAKQEVAFSITNEGALTAASTENETAETAAETAGNKQSANTETDNTLSESTATKKKRKKNKKAKNNAAPKGLWAQLKAYTNSDDDMAVTLDFRALLGGEPLPRFFRRNWLFISVIVFFTCCYVSTRYMMNNAVLENRVLADTLLDRRYKALTINSELLERTLSSHIEHNLRDSTIHTPTEQAFPLKTEE